MSMLKKFTAVLAALVLTIGPVLAATNYPTSLDNNTVFGTALHGKPVAKEHHNNLRDAVLALESKVGINGDGTITSLDYLVKNPLSVDPGHTHSGASITNLNASNLTSGTVPDARLDATIARLNVANAWTLLQTFSSGISVTGTATATNFSGSGSLLTSIPETAITDGAILARLAADETVTGNWTFSGTISASITEASIVDGAILARLGATDTVTGTWTFASQITSSVTTGTAPLVIASTTVVTNLNADLLDGVSAAAFELSVNKAAANGYASLDAGTKVPIAQISEVLATTNLTDVTASTGVGTTIVFNGTPTLLTPTISDFTNAIHDHLDADDGGTLSAAAIASGTFSAARIQEVIALADLTDVTATTGTGTVSVLNNTPTLLTPTIADFTNAVHDHLDADDGGTLDAASVTTGTFASARIAEVLATTDLTDVTATTGTGTTIVFSTSPTFGTSIIVPLVTNPGALSITTTASDGDITLTPDGTGSTVLSSSSGNDQQVLCLADASGTIGHCTSVVGAGGDCTCVAN